MSKTFSKPSKCDTCTHKIDDDCPGCGTDYENYRLGIAADDIVAWHSKNRGKDE